jgi:four helix bundle protein
MRNNTIARLSFEFSLNIIRLYQELIRQHEYIISKQLLRSSTSIGANVMEALDAFSKKDFAFKMSIAKKEARESHYWLLLLNESSITQLKLDNYIKDNESLIKILTSIVKTTSESLNNS